MLRLHKITDADDTRARLDGLTSAVRREVEGAEADPFEDAIVAAVLGAAEALKVEADTLAKIEARLEKAVRRTTRSE